MSPKLFPFLVSGSSRYNLVSGYSIHNWQEESHWSIELDRLMIVEPWYCKYDSWEVFYSSLYHVSWYQRSHWNTIEIFLLILKAESCDYKVNEIELIFHNIRAYLSSCSLAFTKASSVASKDTISLLSKSFKIRTIVITVLSIACNEEYYSFQRALVGMFNSMQLDILPPMVYLVAYRLLNWEIFSC